MVQRDYILREIEKIGTIMNAIRQKLFGENDNLSISIETQIENTKSVLFSEIAFDIDKFLVLNPEELSVYISGFDGFNVENTELLANCISQIGFNDNSGNSKNYLEKALQLYELCNMKSKTFSFERETNIMAIKNIM